MPFHDPSRVRPRLLAAVLSKPARVVGAVLAAVAKLKGMI